MKIFFSKTPTTFWSLFLLFFIVSCGAPKIKSSSKSTVDHSPWHTLLQKHVDQYGLVDYKSFQTDSTALKAYLETISSTPPNTDDWSKEEQMAYWINAYNAFTVDLILKHYPVNSIKDIKNGIPFVSTVWDIKFFKIGEQELDLNNIEHGILRKEFNDPRIHFALVCASMSCPKLQAFAFTGEKLNVQLDEAAKNFLNEPFRNEISTHSIKLSKLLDWYWGDFKDKYESRQALLEAYYEGPFATDVSVEYLDYNWSLNEQTPDKIQLVKGE